MFYHKFALFFFTPVFILAAPPVAVRGATLVTGPRGVLVPRADLYTKIYNTDLPTINQDITNEVKLLNGWANSYQPTLSDANNLQHLSDVLKQDIVTTTGDANSTDPFTTTQSTNIYNYLNSTLIPSTANLCTDYTNHYPGLSVNYKKSVHDGLVDLDNYCQILTKALTNKVTGSAKQNGPSLTSECAAACNSAVAKYSS